jgi:hypothetical protein
MEDLHELARAPELGLVAAEVRAAEGEVHAARGQRAETEAAVALRARREREVPVGVAGAHAGQRLGAAARVAQRAAHEGRRFLRGEAVELGRGIRGQAAALRQREPRPGQRLERRDEVQQALLVELRARAGGALPAQLGLGNGQRGRSARREALAGLGAGDGQRLGRAAQLDGGREGLRGQLDRLRFELPCSGCSQA